MRVYCTGISGVGGSHYINKVARLARAKGKDIKVFNVGQEVFKFAEEVGEPITRSGVLDLDRTLIRLYTGGAYKHLAKEIEKYEDCIIDAHILFSWRNSIIRAVTPNMISWLKPDVFVGLMDLARPIQDRLRKDSNQWQREFERGGLDYRDILGWQNWEIDATEMMAERLGKPVYILPSNDNPDSLYKIATIPSDRIDVAYASFPITHIMKDEESREKIDDFIERLRGFKNLAIISPRSIELPPDPTPVEDQHTVMQDLEWFVRRSTHRVIAYFPKVVFSSGVLNEVIKAAKTACKEVWFVAPPETKDPFTNSIVSRRFYKPEECLEALANEGLERVD